MPGTRRAGLAACALVCAAVLAGCGSGSSGDPVLTVYVSAPLSGPGAADGRDIAEGARLALADADGEATGVTVEMEVLDDASKAGWDGALAGANARTATQDSTAVAYIGELDSGATRTSLPITNEAGLLQVSPGSGAVDLTTEAIGSDQVPPLVQPTGARTFGRVVPSDLAQGQAAGILLAQAGHGSVALFEADTEFSEALVTGLESAQDPPSVVPGGRRAPATYYATEDLAAEGENVIPSSGAIFGSDALLDREGLTGMRILTEACRTRTNCPGQPREIVLTSAPLDPAQLPDAATEFLTAYEGETGRRPGRYAAYGYEAMAVVLDAIDRAEDPLDRTAVVDAFFATEERESILGVYSIDEVGDTTLPALGAYRIEAGRPVAEPRPVELP